MKTPISQDKIVSLLLLTLPTDGVCRVILNLAQGFLARGLKVDVVVLKAEGDALAWIPPGVRIVELNPAINPESGKQKLLYMFSLIGYLRKVQPTAIIVGRDLINLGSIAKYLAMVSTRVILVCHTNLCQYIQNSPDAVKKSPTTFLLKRFLGFYDLADEIVAVSQGVANGLAQLAKRPLKRVRVIYNPVVTTQLLAKAEEPVDHPWFAAGEPPVIVSVGRLQALKDFPTLIRAIAQIRQQMPVRLMILGDGEQRTSLEALIDETGLSSEVALPGFVSNPYAFMSKAAACVMSSVLEGLPTVLIESLAVGTPVISTDCPSGPAEILDHGKYGSLVPIGDSEALAQAIIATLTRATNTELLQQRARDFSLDAVVDSYIDLITNKSSNRIKGNQQVDIGERPYLVN